jgi:uncharacterized membrane protein
MDDESRDAAEASADGDDPPERDDDPADDGDPTGEQSGGLLQGAITRAGGLDRLWVGTVGALVTALVAGSALFTREVWVGFVWRYFWGPVYADAHGWEQVQYCGGRKVESGCDPATMEGVSRVGPVSEPGYTLVSEVGYALVLILMLVGVALLLRRLQIERYRAGYVALLPYMFFGGVLRVVEDASDAARFAREEALRSGVPAAEAPTVPMQYPLNSLFISPVIYFTVFAVAVFGIGFAKYAERDLIDRGYEYPLVGVGTVALLASLGYLVFLAATKPYVDFHAGVLLTIGVLALGSTAVVWWGIDRFAPQLNRGTEGIGLLVLFGQAVDGSANVIGLDWAQELGLPADLTPKHPVNRWVVNTTDAVLPASVTNVTGDAWPFLLVKLVAAVGVIWIFDETVFEESERYTIMLLVAVLAVGLGPGTRDMVRATFGI